MIPKEVSILDIQNKLKITKTIPKRDAFPDPYLSDKPPNIGEATPIINTFKADAKPKEKSESK